MRISLHFLEKYSHVKLFLFGTVCLQEASPCNTDRIVHLRLLIILVKICFGGRQMNSLIRVELVRVGFALSFFDGWEWKHVLSYENGDS